MGSWRCSNPMVLEFSGWKITVKMGQRGFQEWEILEITSLDRKDEFTKDDSPAEFGVTDLVCL